MSTAMSTEMNQDLTRRVAWAVLRRLVEASHTDVVRLLWPDADTAAPAVICELVERLRQGDPGLPAGLRNQTSPHTTRVVEQARADLDWAAAHGWRLVTPDDPEWPEYRLEESFGPTGDLDGTVGGQDSAGRSSGVRANAARPFALWARGPVSLSSAVERSVGMVGTRSSTAYGHRITHRMAGELAGAGYTVVSGGALGIDTAAHRGALDASGVTIAVAASGPGEIYPKSNAPLFRRIAESGLVLTEYPPLTRPARYRFLTRNRLVAALTRGTVLMAAGYRSGAVNTANWADAMVRPVMVVPGPVDSPDYVGCHQRIRDGAGMLVTRTSEVREIIEPVGSVDTRGQLDLDFGVSPVQRLTRDQLAVFDACGIVTDGTGRLEQIATVTGLPLSAVVRTVAELEDAGLVVRSGDRWIKNDR